MLLPTDRQTQHYLLCHECEDILNKGGESWLCDKLATWERSFPLWDIVTMYPPDFDEEGMVLYLTANNKEIKWEKLVHFALGIFWKASVHSWRGDTTDPRIHLGTYSEEIRKWLCNAEEFPNNIFLVTIVERPERSQITLLEPYEGVRSAWRSFFFHVPGLLFMMNVGKTVDLPMQWLCIQNNPGHPIVFSEDLTRSFEQLAVETVKISRRTAAYVKMHQKISEQRKLI